MGEFKSKKDTWPRTGHHVVHSNIHLRTFNEDRSKYFLLLFLDHVNDDDDDDDDDDE